MNGIAKFLVAAGLGAGCCMTSLAQEVTYKANIRPLMQQKCFACHGTGAPDLSDFLLDQKKFEAQMKGPRMDTYGSLIQLVGWPDTGALMRRLDDGKSAKDGKPGNMYQYLGANEEEKQKNLSVFKNWVGPGAWTLKRWKARGAVPAVTKEELDKMQLKY